MDGLELASVVSTKTAYEVECKCKIPGIRTGLWYQIQYSELPGRAGCFVKVFPAKSSYEEVMSFKPHGVFLSNGPGDPAPMTYTHGMIEKVVDSGMPVFGICLGHQLLALSQGIHTYKMHHGHRVSITLFSICNRTM
jgi:carbamoyl-phosphate synthase small subunit